MPRFSGTEPGAGAAAFREAARRSQVDKAARTVIGPPPTIPGESAVRKGPAAPLQTIGADGVPRPARDVHEFQLQVGAIIAAFESHEQRPPEPRDSEFWRAYRQLLEDYFAGAGTEFEPVKP
ncbi:MAG: hypothetical protein AABM29_02855 [Actinomycetota bacterium]